MEVRHTDILATAGVEIDICGTKHGVAHMYMEVPVHVVQREVIVRLSDMSQSMAYQT